MCDLTPSSRQAATYPTSSCQSDVPCLKFSTHKRASWSLCRIAASCEHLIKSVDANHAVKHVFLLWMQHVRRDARVAAQSWYARHNCKQYIRHPTIAIVTLLTIPTINVHNIDMTLWHTWQAATSHFVTIHIQHNCQHCVNCENLDNHFKCDKHVNAQHRHNCKHWHGRHIHHHMSCPSSITIIIKCMTCADACCGYFPQFEYIGIINIYGGLSQSSQSSQSWQSSHWRHNDCRCDTYSIDTHGAFWNTIDKQ